MSLADTLRTERARLQKELSAVEVHLRAIAGTFPNKRTVTKVKRKMKKMSEATKAKIRATMKKKWAAKKKG
jgi:hypothetical protein